MRVQPSVALAIRCARIRDIHIEHEHVAGRKAHDNTAAQLLITHNQPGRLVVAAMRRVRRHEHRNARTVALRGGDSLGLLDSIRETQPK